MSRDLAPAARADRTPCHAPGAPTTSRVIRMLAAGSAAALLASCATAPAPSPPPPPPAPAHFKEDALWKRAQASGSAAAPIGEDWWRVFGDPVLDDLEG
ncbi:MAG: hypothetical protein KGL78_11910, partial [Burkholderiales bacterium]|nr:hypothetical protein [Burkholderiales bacterium]